MIGGWANPFGKSVARPVSVLRCDEPACFFAVPLHELNGNRCCFAAAYAQGCDAAFEAARL